MTMTRRRLLSGFAAVLGTPAADTPLARAGAPLQSIQGPAPTTYQPVHLSVPFGPSGVMGRSEDGQAYLEGIVTAAPVPPLSDVVIYAHGWLTDVEDLMLIYDTMTEGYGSELRTVRDSLQARAAAVLMVGPPLTLPTSTVVITTHWPSRRSEWAPIGLADLVSFSAMEARANLVGRMGMARLIGLVWERLLADPALASTRLLLTGHSFGARVLATALSAAALQSREAFTALQTRNRISLVLLQPAMPADALEPNDLTQAHPFAQLTNYWNLRILVTMSQWDIPLRRFYPPQEAQQPSDADYASLPYDARKDVPALGGAGPTDATWRAFNGDLPRSAVSVGPGFRYGDVLEHSDQRLVVADLTPLHDAHHRQDMARPVGERPPFGRSNRRYIGYSGYHSDIYCTEVYELVIGFATGATRL